MIADEVVGGCRSRAAAPRPCRSIKQSPGRVDTTHQVTNSRITFDRDTARLTVLVEAQHLLIADPGTHALLKNPYTVDLVRDGDRWRIRRMPIENTWLTGDPAAIFGR